MFNENNVCTFRIASPIDIVLHGYPYKSNEVNPILSDIMKCLSLNININELESIYYDIPCNSGDVFVFGNHSNNCIVFDFFRDPYDQLDVIGFGVVCRMDIFNKIRELLEAMRKETDSKVKISGYDFTSPRWAKSVINGDDFFTFNSCTDHSVITQKIIYVK